ncbi:MAG: UPF0182 family protein, partial [Marmoricola sp.]
GDTFSGMSYVGYHSILPGQTLLAWLAVVCGVLLVIAAWRTQWLLSSVAIGLYAVAILGVGVIWPAAMRSASVDGQQLTAERTFVPKNIAATRAAYGLDDIATVRASALTPTVKSPESNPQVQAVRTDLQRASTSFGLLARAEVGYYSVGGKQTELLVAVRRVHGKDLFSAAFANPAGADAAKSNQMWWTAAQLAKHLGVTEKSLAFDPIRTGYEVVSETGEAHGFSLSSWWTRAAAAIRYADPNLLRATGRLVDLRQPLQRVQRLAPWLTLDSQMYPAVVKGRVVWVLDGYTTSATYPESQVASLSAMTADAQNPRPTFGSLVGDNINYIRDSVKVVVDASSGAVTFYAWDEKDPILKAMRSAFPDLVQPKSAMSPQLAAVMRYPTTLFSVQRAMLASYRLTNPADFLATRGHWQVAPDAQSPDLVAAALRGLMADSTGALVPSLSATYADATDAATVAYLVANSDIGSPDFGKLTLHVLPQSPLVVGPSVVVKRFDEDPRVLALVKTLKTTRDGALLTVPLQGGVLQAEAIYGSSVQPGQAKAFVATFGGAIGFGPTLAAAITDISRPHAVKSHARASESSVALVRQADAWLKQADEARAKGDLTRYEKDVARAKALLDRALRDPGWNAPTASPSASPSASAVP